MPLTRPGLVRFAVWFAWQDLTEKEARPATRVVAISLMLTTAAAAVCLALPWAVKAVAQARLAAQPLSQCVWVSDRSPQLSRVVFDPGTVGRLEAGIRERPGGAWLRGCYGFCAIELGWALHAPGAAQMHTVQKPGRTVAPGDPLHDALSDPTFLEARSGFPDPQAEGVIVSRRLLTELGYPDDYAPPSKVIVRSLRTGQPVSLTLVGVTRDPLPLGHGFVITEAEHGRLLDGDNFDDTEAVFSGPVGDFPAPAALPPDVADTLGDGTPNRPGWGLTVYEERKGPFGEEQRVWKLQAKMALPLDQWGAYLIQTRALMRKHGKEATPEFDVPKPVNPVHRPPAPRPGYNWAGIFVTDLSALRPAAATVKEMKLIVDEGVIPQLEEIEANARRTMIVLYGLLGAFCVITLLGMYHLLRMRARQKAGEFGMLRAMGSPAPLLRAVALAEAVLLWAMGTVAGALLAAGLVLTFVALGWSGLSPTEQIAVASQWRWWAFYVGFLIALLLAIATGMVLATRPFRTRPPIYSLSLSS